MRFTIFKELYQIHQTNFTIIVAVVIDYFMKF